MVNSLFAQDSLPRMLMRKCIKKLYQTEEAAEHEIEILEEVDEHKHEWTIRHCEECNGWHIYREKL